MTNARHSKRVRHMVRSQWTTGLDSQTREVLWSQKAALLSRTLRTLGRTQAEIARECGTDQSQIARWLSPYDVASTTLINLMIGADDFVDLMINALAEIRWRNGRARRRWVAVDDDAECVSAATKRSRLERLADGVAGLTALLEEMRGGR